MFELLFYKRNLQRRYNKKRAYRKMVSHAMYTLAKNESDPVPPPGCFLLWRVTIKKRLSHAGILSIESLPTCNRSDWLGNEVRLAPVGALSKGEDAASLHRQTATPIQCLHLILWPHVKMWSAYPPPANRMFRSECADHNSQCNNYSSLDRMATENKVLAFFYWCVRAAATHSRYLARSSRGQKDGWN